MEKDMEEINIPVARRFVDFIKDWDYATYLLIGGYGSGKSWDIAFKLILKCLEEKRTVLIVREFYNTIEHSCFDLIKDILEQMNLLDEQESIYRVVRKSTLVTAIRSPFQIRFPNGSKMIFKGMDKESKVMSIHGVSIVWIEECSDIRYAAFKQLKGRLRDERKSLHFFLSCNPVGKENWVYQRFFKTKRSDGSVKTIVDEKELYEKKTLVKKNVYYHHSLPTDNPFLPQQYLRELQSFKEYDPYLYKVAWLGRFGTMGRRVLPQFRVATNAKEFKRLVRNISESWHFVGLDFGFEESYNAMVKCAVDMKNKILYIYDELYLNNMTDDIFALEPKMQELLLEGKTITADSAEPKSIKYYKQQGFKMRGAKKFQGSRLANTKKMKRFKKIICSPKCTNVISELQDLAYKKDAHGDYVWDQFNIDPHTFSALWYALDKVDVADVKKREFHSKSGNDKDGRFLV